jgi:hypothetical protein
MFTEGACESSSGRVGFLAFSGGTMTTRPSAGADRPESFPGGFLFAEIGRRLRRSRETGALRPLDLGHAAVVDDELDHAVAEALDLLAHEDDPVGIVRGFDGEEVGRGHGKKGISEGKENVQMV